MNDLRLESSNHMYKPINTTMQAVFCSLFVYPYVRLARQEMRGRDHPHQPNKDREGEKKRNKTTNCDTNLLVVYACDCLKITQETP